MNVLLNAMLPEIILCSVACLLFLLGISNQAFVRLLAGLLAFATLAFIFIVQLQHIIAGVVALNDNTGAVRIYNFGQYVKLIGAGVGALLALLNMPTNEQRTGSSASDFSTETAEFFGLLLLSVAGLFVVASTNDLILMFLGLELASIPTYIMVSISRPIPAAQEAGVKYFFLGAMAAAVMLFGFSYLYGTTGSTNLNEIAAKFTGFTTERKDLTPWQILAVVMLISGFAFKMAAVPLHEYAGDVYQGAATPVTAFLAFVPKATGFVALIKILFAIGGNSWAVPEVVVKLLWAMAALTMTFGNVLGLLQFNIKRVLAYSSVAHTGYMLVGVTALVHATSANVQTEALQGVLFYLAAYGIMNTAAFAVLMLLPSRTARPATSAETFEDIAGQGRKHLGLGLAMAVACFSLSGIPLTIGFFGKFYLILPALHSQLVGLTIILVINAAISAAYYLRIVASMFLRPEPTHQAIGGPAPDAPARLVHPWPVLAALILSVLATLLFGTFFPATGTLSDRAREATIIQSPETHANLASVSAAR
jgi:NADH-quinone oxidoreductase subunit N